MIPVSHYSGRAVAVFGLARSGLAAARALAAGGAKPVLWDDDQGRRDLACDSGFLVVAPRDIDWNETAALVLSPGIPLTHPKPHPVVTMARAGGCPVIGDVELFQQAVKAQGGGRIVAITGTNGKSTTTALIGHILEACGTPSAVGGNIGTPALDLDLLGPDGVYSLEISSYQIDLSPSLDADIAVLLNITPDHLDRHGGMDGYVAVKKRLLTQQSRGKPSVIGVDDTATRSIYEELNSMPERRVAPISAVRVAPKGVYALDGVLHDDLDGKNARIADLKTMERLPGQHNWQNAAAAFAAARLIGIAPDRIAAALKTFPGLAHRIEHVAEILGVRFINDSKATNADAAARALACYDEIYWIAGGKAKDGGIDSLDAFFPRIRRAYLIGEAARDFAAALEGKANWEISGDLASAVQAAFQDAKKEGRDAPVVLLSPACASFDQFRDFEERGDAFRRAVAALQPGGPV